MLLVYEVLEKVESAKTKKEKVEILKTNESWALKDIIRGSLDPKVLFNLPTGSPPYTPSEGHNAPSNLLKRNRDFKYFVKGGIGDKLPAVKRESIFIALIESIHPKDAELVISMINKKFNKKIKKEVISEAFPNLI